MAEKVTFMILNLRVDLQCSCCYKKVKKLLCKFPEIRDQVYDEKQNLVKITVFCCNPEKIRDKLCCKGGKLIKSIEIVEPPKPKPKTPVKPNGDEKPVEPEQPKQPEKKPKVVIVVPERIGGGPCHYGYGRPSRDCCGSCSEGIGGGPCHYGYGRPPRDCCGPCSEGIDGGPCHYGYGRPVPPPPCSENYGYEYGYCYGYGKGCSVRRCDYFSEENTGGCNIM